MKKLALFFIMSVSVISVLFLFSGVKTASAKNNFYFFISALPSVHGYRITKDYGIYVGTLGSHDVETANGIYVKYVRVFHYHYNMIYNKLVNSIKEKDHRSNACIDFRVSYQTVSCEAVTIVPKK